MIEFLRIIGIDDILAFEATPDERLAKIESEIIAGGRMHNPLLVTPAGAKFLLLDDAPILAALRRIGVPHLPVQIAEPGSLAVSSWHRIIADITPEDIVSVSAMFPRVIRLLKSPKGNKGHKEIDVCFRGGDHYRLCLQTYSLAVRADLCLKICEKLDRNKGGFRVTSASGMSGLFEDYPAAAAILIPPRFTIEELSGIARRGLALPPGIVRVDHSNRMLGIDFALSILKENVPHEEKEAFLRQLVRLRISSDRTAYFGGGVFMFNR